MKVHFLCGYYPDYAHNNLKRRPEPYWDAYFYVWAVKVGGHRRNFYIHRETGKQHVTAANIAAARESFGRFIESTLRKEDAPDDVLIIPVPSKDALSQVQVKTYRTLDMLREALEGKDHSKSVFDGIRWTKQLLKAHEGASRDRSYWLQHMKVDVGVNNRTVVLIDDLLSTGSTMLAAKEALEAAGAFVLGGVTSGRTVYDLKTKAFFPQEIEFDTEIHEHPGN